MRRRPHLLTGVAAASVAALVASGCGHDHPRLIGDLDGTGGGGVSNGGVSNGGGNQFTFDASTTPPSCEMATPDGGVCGCTDVPLIGDAPTLYFVLDRSGSMMVDSKWTVVRNVLVKVITSIGARAAFAAAVFPMPGSNECTAGGEVMLPRRGDSPAGYVGQAAAAFVSATSFDANGGTPTAATLTALAPRLRALAGQTYVILATDGGPNCDDDITCDVSECIANIESAAPTCRPGVLPNCCDPTYAGSGSCLDTAATVAAVSALRNAGVPTYVVGVPGSAPYANVLDQLAQAGGTARTSEPYYYRVDNGGEAALLTALSQIAAKIVGTCSLALGAPPSDENLVNVYIDGAPVPKDPVNGWSLTGSTITLLGTTCDDVMSGSALDVRIVVGCPTLAPK
jgi:hypothetical protein